MSEPQIHPDLNYLKNIICGAKNGFEDDLAMLRCILRAAPDHAPSGALIRMAELCLHIGLEADDDGGPQQEFED